MRKVTNLLHYVTNDVLSFLGFSLFLQWRGYERDSSGAMISHCEATAGQWQDNSSCGWSQKKLGSERGEKEREMATLGSRLIGHIMSQMKQVAWWDGPYACRKKTAALEGDRRYQRPNSSFHPSISVLPLKLQFNYISHSLTSNSQ